MMNYDEFERIVDNIGETIQGEDLLTTMAAIHCVMDNLLDNLLESGQRDLHRQCCKMLANDYQVAGWKNNEVH
jgi:hypothetical protein